MEVATTNNHSHHLLHAEAGGGGGGGGGGGAGSSGSRSPFQREVREWQRIDPQTGALFSGRLEADRWINGPLNSYGKISDSQNISQPNGTQHTQRKQLEVLQARTANGAMQVIRTQTVQKTSSTSRWSSTSTSTTTRTANSNSNGWGQFKLKSRPSQSVDICELSDGDGDGDGYGYGYGNGYDDDDAASSSLSGSEFTTTQRHNQKKKELVDDHVDFVVINGQSSDQDDEGDTDDVTHLHKLGHNLLPDTAPSLKLSNLMKSSSSISSQSSNNSNLTTAAAAAAAAATATTTTGNTHRSAGKISLHAIVEPASVSASASASSSAWPKQADLYGQGNRRVGVPAAEAGADVVVVGTPTQSRRDLESFRHDNGNDNDEDEDLRLSARHQRRQQVSQSVYAPPLTPLVTSLQRSRSISTDDLSNEWDRSNDNDIENDEHPGEWRRVSKLRRSFQSQDHYKTPTPALRSRPLDLPSNSVSVARMRAELENKRRLNTAMRNNHVDLAALDTILNSTTPKPTIAKRNTFLTAESLQEIRGKLKKLSDESLYKEDFLAYQARRQSKEDIQPQSSAFRQVAHNTHSLESRQRQKDTNSSEWHLRRKSYGFEKMSPPEDKSIFRVDASTDSGLGRSGEQLGNWSPTERERTALAVNNGNDSGPGGTIIHFGRQLKPVSPQVCEGELSKRHSIAVEETWRDIRKTSQVHVNGENIISSSTSTSSHLQRSSAQKRVEFCKTEVHFAAESGRVNIVETDGKPPPTQNFRRRRRTASGPLQSLVKAASASPSSSDASINDSQRRKTIATSSVAYRATLMEPPEVVSNQPRGNATQVTVTIPKPLALETGRFSQIESTSRNSYTSTSGVDTTDNENDDLANIRGILKNKPIKPKPYHLGENIESADVLWSVPLTMKNERESPAGRESATIGESPITTKSVAERIRIVEQRQIDQHQQQSSPAGNGFSTKINVSLGPEDNWENESGKRDQLHYRRRSVQELILEDLRTHQRILDEGLKSTSLIMKTMRSASEFDEAMRRLSIASIESALIHPTIVVPKPMIRSHSYQEDARTNSSLSSRRTSTTSITSSDLFGSTLYDSLPRTPLTPPRLKLLGNTQIPVSQQLTQLRRLYDAADQQEEDSADEEVKRYFRDIDSGGGTQSSSSPEQLHQSEDFSLFKGSEYSSSWSRLKAKRTVWKVEAQGQMLQRADLPKSNVMNIALHSPRVEKPKVTPPTLRIGQLVPVAKPRTLFIQPQPQPQPQVQPIENNEESSSESLKIVKEARGARKLREHELSYFGVQQQQQQQQQQQHQPKLLSNSSTNPRRTLPSRSRLSQSEDVSTTTTTKWQLLNDRPDLLRHSPQGANDNDNHTDNIDNEIDEEEEEEEEHCYENIANELTTTFRVKSASPSNSYERKTDLQRDAQILSEMTHNADQTMKALSDEAAVKDQRRRRSCSLQRRQGKPLETIDEKVKIYNSDRQQAMSVARSTFASEARRNSRQSTPSPTPRARSSSQSSIECCPRARSRSSSRESMTQGGASSDDQATKQRLRLRTPKREKSRHEHTTESRSRHSSKQKNSNSNALPESTKRIYHHHSRHSHRGVEVEPSGEKHTSSGRLMRSSRVSDESRPRSSGQRNSERERERDRNRDRERERERSRVSNEKHREELTRSRGHSSRSRHSEEHLTKRESGTRPSKTRTSRTSHDTTTATTSHKKSTTSLPLKSTSHKSSLSTPTTAPPPPTTTTTTAATAPTAHNELTHGKSTLNGHHQHHHSHHHHPHHQQQQQQSSSKHLTGHGSHNQQHHHVHSLTTTSIAASKQQRDRHGKDRK